MVSATTLLSFFIRFSCAVAEDDDCSTGGASTRASGPPRERVTPYVSCCRDQLRKISVAPRGGQAAATRVQVRPEAPPGTAAPMCGRLLTSVSLATTLRGSDSRPRLDHLATS